MFISMLSRKSENISKVQHAIVNLKTCLKTLKLQMLSQKCPRDSDSESEKIIHIYKTSPALSSLCLLSTGS